MATFNDLFQKENEMLQYLIVDDHNNNNQTPLSQSYNIKLPMDGHTKEAQKRTKHPCTN